MQKPTLRVDAADLDRMTGNLFFEGMKRRSKTSQFWILLLLSGVIATLGIMQDSDATVIGAMIVAPLMTPIIGTALAIVLTDHAMVLRSIGLVIFGALAVIAIGFLFGMVDFAFTTTGNSQVTSRIHPTLISLIAALATGLVGAVSLTRADISDSIPGVAIAIALVPPLAVCGLVLQEGNYADAFGALVLFFTNFSAIVLTGTIVLLMYRVRDVAQSEGFAMTDLSTKSLAIVVGMVILVAIPLAYGSYKVLQDERISYIASPIATQWADEQDWDITKVNATDGTLVVIALGRPPDIDVKVLRKRMDDAGLQDVDMEISLILGGAQEFPGDSG